MSITPIANRQGAVQFAIAQASAKTGIDFNYLLGQAQVESGMRPGARAATSSASGLYQFVEQSWLAVVKKHGAEHGLGWAAEAIEPGRGGRMTVSDPATRRAILNLRGDPQYASLMAAEHAADNKTHLEGALGRPATGTDLYMAHFLGLGGARRFLQALQNNPDRSAAAMFPAAAHANRGVFYGADGQPRSVSEIYQRFATKLDKGADVAGGTGRASAVLGLSVGDNEVIAGNGEDQGDALAWARSTLDQLGGRGAAKAGNLLRPTPDNARLAYLMLARLGGN
ncbi:MAG: lytic transglycosylase domain-containing protein [Sphingomonas sp.]|uniref:lytic transglycosylase domain-containing protein n=1 Tax=Sphingomonas sp. TaxID=28214 RepID=UPI0025CC2804|nr:lytic transglycosylase domain-containing protein [Sphingomonas sp.]MBX9882471.1 lytic transglycosylase domain-containing protein [Sphingomonas sp.]